MKSLFENDTLKEIRTRLDTLSETSEKQWGKMTAGQMAHHCQLPLNVMLEKENYNLKPNWFVKVFFKKAMYSDKLWKKNLPTMKQFKETTERDLTTEKQKLQQLLDEFETQRERTDWKAHPSFGELTKVQWGKMQYKHLDHHLRQFNV